VCWWVAAKLLLTLQIKTNLNSNVINSPVVFMLQGFFFAQTELNFSFSEIIPQTRYNQKKFTIHNYRNKRC